MPITLDDVLGLHARALTLRSKRADVLAANIANADTPRFKARDFDFKAVMGQANDRLRLTRTSPAHMSSEASEHLGNGQLQYRVPNQPALDGNTVEAQTEKAEFMKNAMHYTANLTFLNSRISGLLRAIRGE